MKVQSKKRPDSISQMAETQLGTIEYASVGDGPAVLCLHGAMGGFDQGLILAQTLGQPGYRTIAVSRPGYLRTPLSLGKSPEQQADLCAALLDTLGLDQACVMAVSGGGPTAIHFALRHRNRCSALVLVSAPAQPLDNRPPLAFKLMKYLVRIPWIASAIERKAIEQPETMAKRSVTNEVYLQRTMADAEAWDLFKALLLSTSSQMHRRFAGTENDAEIAATRHYALEAIQVPTMVLQGTADPFVPFEQNGKHFAQCIQGVELVALEDGEHPAIFTHHKQAKQEVARFLRKLSWDGVTRKKAD